jgi:hypothetical protein
MGFPFVIKKGQANAEGLAPSVSEAKWKTDAMGNTYFVPMNLRTDQVEEGRIVAKVDGWWRSYDVREYDDNFHEWWIEEKNWYYDQLIAFFSGETDELGIPNGGHHHPMLTTYGKRRGGRGDSDFHLNCAPKGFTIIPKADKIEYINQQIDEAYQTPPLPVSVFQKRKELYADKTLWDKSKFATLELYSGRPINADDPGGPYGFQETHTFQNVMANPMSTLTYMALFSTEGGQAYFEGVSGAIPTFEFRGFSWMIAHHNPANTEYEQKMSTYINDAHCRYHGGACDIATNIFVICEQFNNTPGYDPYGRGRRAVPPFTYGDTTTARRTIKPKRKLTTEEKLALLKQLHLPV